MSRGMLAWFIVAIALQLQSTQSQDLSPANFDEPGIMVLMDGRGQRRDFSNDIEARRRSALDKNFMRFGRTNPKSITSPSEDDVVLVDPYDVYDSEYSQRLNRNNGKQDGFIRFGRRSSGDFIRFGRAEHMTKMYPTTRSVHEPKQKNFIRFGKRFQDQYEEPEDVLGVSDEPKRFKRNTEDVEQKKSEENIDRSFERVERGRNLIRFGRNGNFMRFGRDHLESDPNSELNKLNENHNENSPNCPSLNLNSPYNPFLLKYHSIPLWMLSKEFLQLDDESHKPVKKLNSIRFG